MMDIETIQLALEDTDGSSGELSLLTVNVTEEQETAMEAFFQINSWQLIKVSKTELAGEEGSNAVTVSVTSEQKAALQAFFQINSWDVKFHSPDDVEEEECKYSVTMVTKSGHSLLNDSTSQNQQTDNAADGTTLEKSEGGLIKVTTSDADGHSQVITLFTENSDVKTIPATLLGDFGHSEDRKEMPQVIIQEITLPEGVSLDQGLLIANSEMNMVKRVTPRGSIRPGDKVYKCHVCDKTFKQLQSFNGHYQSHFGAKPFKCSLCNKGFTLKAALVSHQSIHSGTKPFNCYLCNKAFRRKDDMMCHLRTHTGEKPYECDICGKKFKYRNQIPKHRRGHTGERPYECETCHKSFTTNIHLARHIRTHTGERPYKCTTCDKAFTQYGHLQAHTRIHTGERPYQCEVCGRWFREKKVMKRHEQLHTTERKFKCNVCGRGFLRQSNLDLHAVMHQKVPKDNPLFKRPRPRPRKKQADAEMRAFVANVLSSVKKVDSGIQTDPATEQNYINGVPDTDESGMAADNLSAFVNFAVQQDNKDTNAEIQNDDGQQYTLVMQEDGNGGYLISNYDGSGVSEEVVNSLPSQQEEGTSGGSVQGENSADIKEANFDESAAEIVVKSLEKVIYANNVQDTNSVIGSSFTASASNGHLVLSNTDSAEMTQDVGNL